MVPNSQYLFLYRVTRLFEYLSAGLQIDLTFDCPVLGPPFGRRKCPRESVAKSP